MVTENKLQSNKNLHKPKISNLHDVDHLKSSLSHHTYKGLVRVANHLAGMGNSYKKIHPSIYTISRAVDLSEDQVIRVLQEGERLGLWTITHRKNFHQARNKFGILSNLYTLNPIFFDMNWRNAMSSIFTALKYLPLTILLITTSILATNHSPNLQSSFRSKDTGIDLDYFSYIKKQNAYRMRAREEFAICTSYSKKENSQIRERLIMNDVGVLYDNTVFSETVRKAGKELTMSCAGMCSISSFNDMVINVALKRIATYSKTIQNPFGLFISICNQVSKEMRIPVKHNKAYALASQFDIKLGKEAAVLEGGNKPIVRRSFSEGGKEPQQWEHVKLPTTANRRFASTHKVHVLPLEDLRLKNPSISIVAVKQLGGGMVEVQHHHDIEWRETTQEERDTWLKKQQEFIALTNNPFSRFIPLNPPISWKGNLISPAFKFYHIDQDNVLHDPESLKLGCKLCDKKSVSTAALAKVEKIC